MAICWNRLDKVGGIIGCNILFRNTFWFNYLVIFRPEEKEEIALQLWNGINFDLKSKIRKQALPGVFDLYVKFKSLYTIGYMLDIELPYRFECQSDTKVNIIFRE